MNIGRRKSIALFGAAALFARSGQLWAESNLRVPNYVPPLRGAPGGRIGGGSRGSRDDIPSLLVLAPDHVGQAMTDQPIMYWYLSQPTPGASIKISVSPTAGGDAVIAKTLSDTVERGIHAISLADANVHLTPGTEYEWRITFTSDSDASKSVTSRGLVAFADAKPNVKRDIGKAKPDDLPFVYAAAGYWYDSLQALAKLIAENPSNASYKLMRASLLDQVRLHDAADYDREENANG